MMDCLANGKTDAVYRDENGLPELEVHSIRPARRIGPDGQTVTELVIEMTQRRRGYIDLERQRKVESGELAPMEPDFILRGGCTLLVDLETARVRYCIYKDLSSQNRMERMRSIFRKAPVRLCRLHIWETLVENISIEWQERFEAGTPCKPASAAWWGGDVMPAAKITASTAGDTTFVPPSSGVAVRMYNTGFGDCFLLAFRSDTGEARYVLIDCGVHQKWKGGKERLKLVASDIAKATNNHLHVVAVTHEHTDHVSGFLQGESAFGKMKIDNLWLAWTEDPSDQAAKQLKAQYGVKIRALKAAVSRLRLAGNPLGERLEGMLDFDLDLELEQNSGQNPGRTR